MGTSTRKKVVIRRFDREPLPGVVEPTGYLTPTGIELLSPSGAYSVVPYEEVKAVCFVRDFDDVEPWAEKPVFQTRPKTEGLWVRMRFRDGEVMDGLLPNRLLDLEPYGFTLVPPDAASSQRIFVPRVALKEMEVLSVVGSALRRPKPRPAPKEQQLEMFE